MAEQDENKVYIVGAGDDGMQSLTDAAKTRIGQADRLLGSERTLALIPPGRAERVVIGADLGESIRAQRGDR